MEKLAVVLVLTILGTAFAEEEKTVCSLVQEMVGSATKCIAQNAGSGGSRINLEVPKEVVGLLRDPYKRACTIKCVLEDRELVDAQGVLNSASLLKTQNAIPVEMREKMTAEVLQPCLDISAKIDPKNCTTYSDFSSCLLGVIVDAFDPVALDCFTKIPAVGPLFSVLQSALQSQGEGGKILGGGFFKRIRDQVSSSTGNGVSRIRDWVKDIDHLF